MILGLRYAKPDGDHVKNGRLAQSDAAACVIIANLEPQFVGSDRDGAAVDQRIL
jgi:hypothetical protein